MKRKRLVAKKGKEVKVRSFPIRGGLEAQDSGGLQLRGVWVAGGPMGRTQDRSAHASEDQRVWESRGALALKRQPSCAPSNYTMTCAFLFFL